MKHQVRASALPRLLVAGACLVGALLVSGRAAAATPAMTQIDLSRKGSDVHAKCLANKTTQSVSVDVWLKNRGTGQFEKVTLTLTISCDWSPVNYAEDVEWFLRQLAATYDVHWSRVDNSVTLWPTDASQDPHTTGNPDVQPPGAKLTQCKVVKETHPI